MSSIGNISEVLFKIDHTSLKIAIRHGWQSHSANFKVHRELSEVELFAKILENFLRSTLGKDVLTLLRVTGYQVVLSKDEQPRNTRMWVLTGRGPAIVSTTPENPEGSTFYLRYPFEILEFAEQVLSKNPMPSMEIMKTIVDSINSITHEVNESHNV